MQRLSTLRDERGMRYEVIAYIAGRGFKIRRNDMRRLLLARNGMVFTLSSIEHLVVHTRIRGFATVPNRAT